MLILLNNVQRGLGNTFYRKHHYRPDLVRRQLVFIRVAAAGHLDEPKSFIDRTLLEYNKIKTAAGTPDVFLNFSPENWFHDRGAALLI